MMNIRGSSDLTSDEGFSSPSGLVRSFEYCIVPSLATSKFSLDFLELAASEIAVDQHVDDTVSVLADHPEILDRMIRHWLEPASERPLVEVALELDVDV